MGRKKEMKLERLYQDSMNKQQFTTRNIRKLGGVANLNLCAFIQNHNGLIGLRSEIPASAYCHPLCLIGVYEKKLKSIL